MRTYKHLYITSSVIVLLAACVTVVSFVASGFHPQKTAANSGLKRAEKGFAIVELFTSERCVHCPPAHDFVARIQKENPANQVYVLTYHVDFWDRKTSKDRFSDAAFSRRQISYAHWLNVPKVYAPQIIVNGKSEFTGTDESQIRSAINKVLLTPSKAYLSTVATRDQHTLTLQYEVRGGSKDSRVQIAIIRKSAEGKVAEGKSKGHLFQHVQIVDSIHNALLDENGRGSAVITLPQGFNGNEWDVIAFVQNLNNGSILTATRVSL